VIVSGFGARQACGQARPVGELVPGQALAVTEPQEHPLKGSGGQTGVRHRRLLPVGVLDSGRASRANGRRARRSAGQGDRRSVLTRPSWASPPLWGHGPPPREAVQPVLLCRGRCGTRAADPSSWSRPRLLALAPASGSASERIGGDFGSNPRRLRPGAWASPATSERASHEVPECGHAPSPSRSWLGPTSTPPRRPKSDPAPTFGLACDAPVRRPLATRLPSLPTAAPADHLPPYKDRKEPGC
jgi:hypothetical protein